MTGFVPLGKIADYNPPISSGATRADLDNNLWILPTTTAASLKDELVYSAVNSKGELAGRVRVPEGRSIVGFGRHGVVHLMVRVDKRWVIKRTTMQR